MMDLWIVQPYVPRYRVAFFEQLSHTLGKDNISVHVVAGVPHGAQANRGDAALAEWLTPTSGKVLSFAGRTLTLTSTQRHWRHADAVVVPHMGSSMDANWALGVPRRRLRVGIWGHIASYVMPEHPIDVVVERWQVRRADHIFAYTPGGARKALEMGAAANRITTVMNSVDTKALESAYRNTEPNDIHDFSKEHGLAEGRTLGYVGGIDASKRIDLLAEALDILWERDRRVKIVVGGRGSCEHLLAPAVERGQAILLGYAGNREMALIGHVASAIAMPGRVGLVAVQALALGIPILTTSYPYHAPEYEYLQPGKSVYVSRESGPAFADLVETALLGSVRADPGAWSYPTIADMVANYADGIRRLVEK